MLVGVVGAVEEAIPLLLDVAVVEFPARRAGGNACGLCRGVVAGEGVLDLFALAFTRGSGGHELGPGPVNELEPEPEPKKLEPELELDG